MVFSLFKRPQGYNTIWHCDVLVGSHTFLLEDDQGAVAYEVTVDVPGGDAETFAELPEEEQQRIRLIAKKQAEERADYEHSHFIEARRSDLEEPSEDIEELSEE